MISLASDVCWETFLFILTRIRHSDKLSRSIEPADPRCVHAAIANRAQADLISGFGLETLEERWVPATVSDGGTATLQIALQSSENLYCFPRHHHDFYFQR